MTHDMWKHADCAWMRDGKFGTMTHYLADGASHVGAVSVTPEAWNRRVDSFDADAFASRLSACGVRWHLLTLGQNSGHYCSPNATYDAIVGGESRLSRRDLVADLAAALAKRGIRTMAYLPSHAPANHRRAVEALGFTPRWDYSGTGIRAGDYISTPDIDARLTGALRNWEAVVREWSMRWGSAVSGWWIDGCYYADRLYRHADAPNFRSFAEALKAGNPDSVVAFNSGCSMEIRQTAPEEDYSAGETDDLVTGNRTRPMGKNLEGRQLHILTYLADWWGAGEPRYPHLLAAGYTRYVADQAGAVTWDIPVSSDGGINDPFLRQLSAIAAAVR